MTKANLGFVCKDPGNTDAEIGATGNFAEAVVHEFAAIFPDRLPQTPEIHVTGGNAAIITMMVGTWSSRRVSAVN